MIAIIETLPFKIFFLVNYLATFKVSSQNSVLIWLEIVGIIHYDQFMRQNC